MEFIKKLPTKPSGVSWGLYRCFCGKKVESATAPSSRKKNCGCARFNKRSPVIGEVHNKLKLIKILPRENSKMKTKALFLCDCGIRKILRVSEVRSGSVKSCGCLLKEPTGVSKLVDGVLSTKHPLYPTWRGILKRTNKENTCKKYENYRVKGITVCESWRKSFKKFVEDMGPKPDKNYSIERIDNSKGYYPENCKWATPLEQSENRDVSTLVTYKGETKSIGRWEMDLKLPRCFLRNRINKGWSVEDAFECPKGMHLTTFKKKRGI